MQQRLSVTEPKDILLVDTFPRVNLHKSKSGIINIGLEYAAQEMGADVVHWQDVVDVSGYRVIGFNVIYPTYVLNIVPFLRRQGIEPVRALRSGGPDIIVGGPGATNIGDGLVGVVDSTFYGEIDGVCVDGGGFHRVTELESKAIVKGKRAVLEIARGCKHRCGFCEYGHVLGGPYREKTIDVVREQLLHCRRKTGDITLRTSNLGSYSDLDKLVTFCKKHNITQRWGDISPIDAEYILPHLKDLKLYTPKMGIESFDETTRRKIGKASSDADLEGVLERLFSKCSAIHLYLIYGLPGDNYEEWFRWARILKEIREKQQHKVRVDFSITNFNPCPGTPLEDAPLVDFDKKEKFLKEWISTLKELGFYKKSWDIKPGNDFGRLGRKEPAYLMNYMLRYNGKAITRNITDALPSGVGRSISDKEAITFINHEVN